MNIAEVLSGQAGLAGVQWALLARPTRKVLRAELGALLSGGRLGPCRLQRAKFKPGRKLTAYYTVRTCQQGAGGPRSRPVAVVWTPAGTNGIRELSPEALAMQAEALDRGLASPFAQLAAEVPAWGMNLCISPLDAHFPQLVRLSDPRYVRDMLTAVYDTHLAAPSEPAAQYTVVPIRYRPGQRHVLRYDPAVGASDNNGVVFAKLYANGDGARFGRVARRVADWLTECGAGLAAVRPQAYVAADAAVLYPRVAGTPLSWYLQRGGRYVAGCLRRAGIILRALHDAPAAVAAELVPHDLAGEVKLIARASEHIHALLPPTGATIITLLDRAQALNARLPQEGPTLAHGDFKADHLWVTGTGLTLIDFDACCLADPALDIGKFLADLHWWYALSNRPGVEQAQTQFLEGYGLDLPARLVRARLYEALWLVKITVRRARLFDRGWMQRSEQLINRAEAVLYTVAAAN
jgi:aminoglycoside phosphotransferase (APT) family kinase protein